MLSCRIILNIGVVLTVLTIKQLRRRLLRASYGLSLLTRVLGDEVIALTTVKVTVQVALRILIQIRHLNL
jgi:hypothetical protein